MKFTEDRKVAYCNELRKHGEAPIARETVGISGDTVCAHRKKDPVFAQMEREAIAGYKSSIAVEIDRRGREGWDEPIYQNGKLVGHKRRYSDTLLLAQAKRWMRDEYGDKVKVDQTTHQSLGIEDLSKASRDKLREILEDETETDVS
jgi:hypothetical protein